ncbi:hypothetical protein BH11MYX3_BH11MYX3_33640 [soil metagenome]
MSLLAQDQQLTRRVGAIALAAIAGAFVFFFFLYPRIELGSPTRIEIYFHHSGPLRENASLMVGGKRIGHIESMASVPRGGKNPLNGEVGTVAIIALDAGQAWKVPADADVFVASLGVLSEKYLEVAPPRGGAVPGPPVHDGSQLLAADPPSLDNVLGNLWTNMATLRLFAEQVGPELAALRTQVAAMQGHLADVAADIEAISPSFAAFALAVQTRALVGEARTTYEVGLGGEAGFGRFQAMIGQVRGVLTQARAALDKLQPMASQLGARAGMVRDHVAEHDPAARIAETLARARLAIDKIDPLLAKVEDITGRLARGEGSLGLLQHDPEFPEDARELGKVIKRHPWRVIFRPFK